MPIETEVVNGRTTLVKADLVPCHGGPLTQLRLHRPYDTTVPCSDGKYRLVEVPGAEPYYQYEPEGRRRLGHGPDS